MAPFALSLLLVMLLGYPLSGSAQSSFPEGIVPVSNSSLATTNQSPDDHYGEIERLATQNRKLTQKLDQLTAEQRHMATQLEKLRQQLAEEQRLTLAVKEELRLAQNELTSAMQFSDLNMVGSGLFSLADTAAIENRIETWRKAWSMQDVEKYLDCYSSNFQPENGLPRAIWRKERAHRLTKPDFIQIWLQNLRAEKLDKNTVTVTLEQEYRSDDYSDLVTKQLLLGREATGWKIIAEKVLDQPGRDATVHTNGPERNDPGR